MTLRLLALVTLAALLTGCARSSRPRPAPAPKPGGVVFGKVLPGISIVKLPPDIEPAGRWSPDSRWVLAQEPTHQFLFKVDFSGTPVRLYSHQEKRRGAYGYLAGLDDYEAAWTDNGKRVWFTICYDRGCDAPLEERYLSVAAAGGDVRNRPWRIPAVAGDRQLRAEVIMTGHDYDKWLFEVYAAGRRKPILRLHYRKPLNTDDRFIWLPDSSGVVWMREVDAPVPPGPAFITETRLIDIAKRRITPLLPVPYRPMNPDVVHALPGKAGLWIWLDANPKIGLKDGLTHTAILQPKTGQLAVRSYDLRALGPVTRLWELVPSPNQNYLLAVFMDKDRRPGLYAVSWDGATVEKLFAGWQVEIAPDGSRFLFRYPHKKNDQGLPKYGIANIKQAKD